MILHKQRDLYRDAILFTANQMSLPPIYVEKDYWVTYALYMIFQNQIGLDTVFKGGTALSKCFGLIDRFSEDIDLVVLRREDETDSRLKTKIKSLGRLIADELPEVEIVSISHKRGMNRKTAHVYPKEFAGDYGQVRDVIVLESTWLGHYEPYTQRKVSAFVGEMMRNNGQHEIAEANGLMPFEVRVLDPTRTLCEKIMSLVRFSYSPQPIDDLRKKIRHVYDLHQLLQQDEYFDFFQSDAFDAMLLKVAQDDVLSFRNNNDWLNSHPSHALVFQEIETVWPELKASYNGDFKNLVYGNFPAEQKIFSTLKQIKQRLSSIAWDTIVGL